MHVVHSVKPAVAPRKNRRCTLFLALKGPIVLQPTTQTHFRAVRALPGIASQAQASFHMLLEGTKKLLGIVIAGPSRHDGRAMDALHLPEQLLRLQAFGGRGLVRRLRSSSEGTRK